MLVFCATEPGGAKVLAPVAVLAMKQGEDMRILSSAKTLQIFEEKNLVCEEKAFSSVEEAEFFLRDASVSHILLGTEGEIGNIHYLTAAARALGVPSLSVLDEWTNYALRFQDEQGNVGKYLPDIICVQDEESKGLAIADGLPGNILRITGNPSLADIKIQAEEFKINPPDCPNVLSKLKFRPRILFLSERLQDAFGSGSGGEGAFGTSIGYHEGIVRDDLVEILSKQKRKVSVLEKFHPMEGKKEPPPLSANSDWHALSNPCPLWPLLWHADLIIGMRTMVLLEAALLGRKPISYQPGGLRPLECAAVRLGVAESFIDKEAFSKRIVKILEGNTFPLLQESLPELSCTNPEASEQILAIAQQIVA